MTAQGNFEIDTPKDKCYMLVGYAKGNHLKITNTFFDRKASKKWARKSPNGETKNESTSFFLKI